MKKKYNRLLQYLNEQPHWISSSQLAEKFSLSKRTIKTYIADIQAMEPGLIISSNKGYRLAKDKLETVSAQLHSSIPESPSERLAYLLLTLISSKTPISIYALAESLYVSESTVLNDAKKLKKRCLAYSLEVKQTKETLQLTGSEKAKRQLIRDTLLSELDNSFMDITRLQESFSDFDLEQMKEIVAEIFAAYDFFTNDYALTNIVIHLAIAVDRTRGDFPFQEMAIYQSKLIDPIVMEIAKEITRKVATLYDIQFLQEEIWNLALLISANGTSVNFTQITVDELEQVADQRCLEIVAKILDKVHEFYFVNSNDSEFLIRFTLHIKNLLYRIDNGYTCRNPLTKTLKRECPLIYDCAVQVSYVLQKELSYTINEDEIAYIAFHLGYALEMQKQRLNKINCAILVPHYYNMNVQILEKLKKNFGEDLEIRNILTDEKELQHIETELIISTVRLNHIFSTPCVVINPFFTLEDRKQIAAKIFNIKGQKRSNLFTQNFLPLVDPKRFLIIDETLSFETVLKRLCAQLEEEKIVKSNFFSQVMERENLSSTAFGFVAIPHSLTMDANRTSISIGVSHNGIKWGNQNVTLIFLISINYRERHVFREIFEDLAMICTDEQNVHKLSQIKTFDSFIETLIDCFNKSQ